MATAAELEEMLTPVSEDLDYDKKLAEARDLKDLQKAADYFLKNSHIAGIDYDNR